MNWLTSTWVRATRFHIDEKLTKLSFLSVSLCPNFASSSILTLNRCACVSSSERRYHRARKWFEIYDDYRIISLLLLLFFGELCGRAGGENWGADVGKIGKQRPKTQEFEWRRRHYFYISQGRVGLASSTLLTRLRNGVRADWDFFTCIQGKEKNLQFSPLPLWECVTTKQQQHDEFVFGVTMKQFISPL